MTSGVLGTSVASGKAGISAGILGKDMMLRSRVVSGKLGGLQRSAGSLQAKVWELPGVLDTSMASGKTGTN